METIEHEDLRAQKFLAEKGTLEASQIAVIEKEQLRSGLSFLEAALSLRLVDEPTFLSTMTHLYALEWVDLERALFDTSCFSVLPKPLALACEALVIEVRSGPGGEVAKIALADPGNLPMRDTIMQALPAGMQAEFVVSLRRQIRSFLAERQKESVERKTEVQHLAYALFQEAISQHASDVHFEPGETLVRVRLRKDGALLPFRTLHRGEWPRLCGYLKIISNLNITEHRKPQSGHARIRSCNRWVDLRVSTHPSLFGEALVVRILDAEAGLLRLPELGFEPNVRRTLERVLKSVNGIFLVVGPTGSGKTTTLYALLQALRPEQRNILTLEDPVEYQIPGVRQLDLREEGVVSFAEGIRSALRQDPDVILIGEIRDESTAVMALRAALTGRLVLATLHARDVFSTFDRLQDLGLSPREVVPHLVGILAQRLVSEEQHGLDPSFPTSKRHVLAEILHFSQKLRKDFLETDHRTHWQEAACRHGFVPFPSSNESQIREDHAAVCL
ncbi:MAG: Flp pilus assembly complex ATPase component TadA [Holosporales bacterium]|jgi:general secretion pathway protein E/type IV pilus assembly protein PilB|nr:Flp pilus assembly complex ATPase component TadA [Holosporales bacterium]